MNEHLKLKTVSGDIVWGGVSFGEGTRQGARNRQKLSLLDPVILSLKHPDFWLLPFKVRLPVLHDLFAAPRSLIFTPIEGGPIPGVLVIQTLQMGIDSFIVHTCTASRL